MKPPNYQIALAVLLVLLVSPTISAFAQTATVERNSNLRKSASSSSTVVELLPAGTQVSLISNRKLSGYYHVRAQDGEAGWVFARNVTASTAAETSPTAIPSTAQPAGPQSAGQGFEPVCALP